MTRSISCARWESPNGDPRQLFDIVDEHRQVFDSLLARGRGIVLVTGHYGNWEVGSLLIRSALELPLTIVAMAEADPTVNRIRLEIREKLGAETIEVRQSLDTALQIRRRLADNRIVAMLVDRHFGKDRVAVTMFGRAAWLLRTPLLMAHVSGAPLLPCSIERIGPGRFKARPGTPIFVAADIPRDEAIACGCTAGGRRPCRAGSWASRVLVPLLQILGFAARRLRRARLTGRITMDPLSHVAFSRTLIGVLPSPRRIDGPRGAHVAAAVLGSLSPDIDAVFMPFGWDRYLRVHEVGTHTVEGTQPVRS